MIYVADLISLLRPPPPPNSFYSVFQPMLESGAEGGGGRDQSASLQVQNESWGGKISATAEMRTNVPFLAPSPTGEDPETDVCKHDRG